MSQNLPMMSSQMVKTYLYLKPILIKAAESAVAEDYMYLYQQKII